MVNVFLCMPQYLIHLLFLILDYNRPVEEYETKIDILREMNHRRVKNYSQDRENTSWFKRRIKSKLQTQSFNYHVNYHPG